LNKNIPVVNLPLDTDAIDSVLGTARIIAGELGEVKGPQDLSPVQMWDYSSERWSEIDHHSRPDNCIIFVRRGSVEILGGGRKAQRTEVDPRM
jgi:redox-sensitive bicupin YhaK (pirin superfamily)